MKVPRRGETFVSRKIAHAVAAIHLGLQDCLYIGNLNSRRDWGHARDYVDGMWLILQQDRPDDYVLATGESHSVREFVELAFTEVGITIDWKGTGTAEHAVCRKTGRTVLRVDPRYFRPTEVDTLVGDSTKARQKFGWKPRVGFKDLVPEMVASELRLLSVRSADGSVIQNP